MHASGLCARLRAWRLAPLMLLPCGACMRPLLRPPIGYTDANTEAACNFCNTALRGGLYTGTAAVVMATCGCARAFHPQVDAPPSACTCQHFVNDYRRGRTGRGAEVAAPVIVYEVLALASRGRRVYFGVERACTAAGGHMTPCSTLTRRAGSPGRVVVP